MKSEIDKHIEAIEAIEKSRKIQVISLVVVVILVIGYVLLFRPDIPRSVSESVVSGVKNLTSKIVQEEEKEEVKEEEEEPVVEENITEEPEPEPGTVLTIGSVTNFRGKTIILTYVSSKETYCMFRVNDESVLVTTGRERNVNGMTIKVLEAKFTPSEMCRVILK